MQERGLKPSDYFIDVGCGSLRGGVHFIEYLDSKHYSGADINASLIEAGITHELDDNQRDKIDDSTFCVSDNFTFDFGSVRFDYGIAVSLFTHLSTNKIRLCLQNLRRVFKDGGSFYATFFEQNGSDLNSPCEQEMGVVSYSYKDPFHYMIEDIVELGKQQGWDVNWIGDFAHPRNQQMCEFIAR
jgi:ubiquinone/menaquinone biosynthesis C-methylase UbiE